MAYRLEKEPSGDYAIVIDGWEKGIAPDPYTGPSQLLSVNLNTPGEVSVGYPLTQNTTSGATLGVPVSDSVRFFVYGSAGVPTGSPQSFAILDADGHVFENASIAGAYTFLSASNSTSGSSNLDGIAYWLGYLFKTRGSNIDYWDGSVWHTGWKTTLLGNVKHQMYVASDNVLYITNGNFLASITAPSPTVFDPTNTTTYAFSITKLELPVTDIAISIAEVGAGNSAQSTLLIGGTQNAIYPWDKTSSSFALPIYVGDSYIKNMVSVNQNVFIFPGNTTGRGRIYITNGSQADEWFKIPDHIFGELDPYYEWGDAIFHRNNLIFGFLPSENSGAAAIQNINYVWAIDLETKAFRAISQLSTTSSFFSSATSLIPTYNLSSPGFGYIVGASDGLAGSTHSSISYSGTTAGIGFASIETELIPVGTFLQKKTFSQIEFKLRSPLQSGEDIQMLVQLDNSSLSSNLVFSPTPTTGSISAVAPVNFQNNQWLRLIINTTGNNALSGVRLKEIRIR